MENKPVNQKPRKKSEFRYHDVFVKKREKTINIQHPTYVFLEKQGKYVYVSITHSPYVKDTIVIKLRKNPNPNDERESYRVVEIREDIKENFGKVRNGWTIDPEDENEIREEYKKENP